MHAKVMAKLRTTWAGKVFLAFALVLGAGVASMPARAFAATSAQPLAATADDVPFVIIALVLIVALVVMLLAMRNRNKG